jgi:catechol 2,3-dioxygenase-like lactoylglutathione lyase family enzyme
VSRVQLALTVADIETAVDFYSRLFATEPAKRRPGYANFAVADPPLKLVLIEDATRPSGSLDHLGVEVETSEEVAAAQTRLAGAGLATAVSGQVSCCHALQDKVWVDGPGGAPWEIYAVLADVDTAAGCCAARPDLAAAGPSCC